MNKLLSIRSFLVLAIAFIAIAMIGCSEKGPGSNAPQIDGNLVINIERSPAKVMGLVQFYVLTVSGSDMEPVADTVMNAQDGFVVFDVPVPIGEKRLFVLEGVRGGAASAPQVIYRGQTVAPVRPGAITTLNLVLRPVVPMVRLSPIMPVLEPGQPLELQVEVYNLVNLASISIDFHWPWELFGDDITVELSDRQSPDVSFYVGYEGSWMGMTVADTLGGTIVNEQGNGVLANITLQPLTQVGPEDGTATFGIFEIDTVWSFTILGEMPGPEQILYENSEIRLLPVTDREVLFPDSALMWEVRRVTNVLAPSPIMLSDVVPLTNFSIVDLNVGDLRGIENMINLSSLNISHNPIQNITYLFYLNRLTSLSAENVGATSIVPLVVLRNMRYLQLSSNRITDISSLSGMTKLSSLYLSINQITDISPLAGMDDLTWLYLGDNMISDISVLAGLPNLYRLHLYNNMITDIRPLVDNTTGIGAGDVIELWGNAALISDPIQQAHVATLRERGVTVNMAQPVK